jgi:multiple sugar transport system permease protein
VRPALLVAALLSFIWTWHEFFGPLIYLSDRNQYPLSLGLFAFRAQHTIEWSLLMAASMLATLPLVVFFFCTQRSFLEIMTLTGIKS